MSEPDEREEEFADIAAAAKAAEDEERLASSEERIAVLEERLATIEPLLEQLQANAELSEQVANYTADLREEQRFFDMARYSVGGIAFLALVFLVVLLGVAILHGDSPLLEASPAVVATFVLGMVSGIIFIVVSFIKGVFRTTVERHADGFKPPALSELLKALEKLT